MATRLSTWKYPMFRGCSVGRTLMQHLTRGMTGCFSVTNYVLNSSDFRRGSPPYSYILLTYSCPANLLRFPPYNSTVTGSLPQLDWVGLIRPSSNHRICTREISELRPSRATQTDSWIWKTNKKCLLKRIAIFEHWTAKLFPLQYFS